MGSSDLDKPAILCLHGGGSSAMIFSVQAARVQRCLREHFTFVFVDAPLECPAGPGILPTFEGCHPFFTWITPNVVPERALEATEIKLKQVMLEQRSKTGQPFVGVMGFSQGARVATRLLQQQQQRRSHSGWNSTQDTELQFAILMNGSYGPGVEDQPALSVTSVHVLGKQDPYYQNGRKLLSNCYEEKDSTLLEFDVDHRLPLTLEDTEYLSSQILRAHFVSQSLSKSKEVEQTTEA